MSVIDGLLVVAALTAGAWWALSRRRRPAALAVLGVLVLLVLGVLLRSVRLFGLTAVSVMGVSFVSGGVSMSVAVTDVLLLRAPVALLILVVAVAVVGVRALL